MSDPADMAAVPPQDDARGPTENVAPPHIPLAPAPAPPVAEGKQRKHCPRCHGDLTRLGTGARFCPRCGLSMGSQTEPLPPGPLPVLPLPAEPDALPGFASLQCAEATRNRLRAWLGLRRGVSRPPSGSAAVTSSADPEDCHS